MCGTGGPHGKAEHIIAVTPLDEETFSTGDGWRGGREGVPYVLAEYRHSGRMQQGDHTSPLRLSLSTLEKCEFALACLQYVYSLCSALHIQSST